MTEPKRLYRSRSDRIFAGVCGGLARYFNLDPVLVRLAVVVIVLVTGFFPGVVAYLIAWLIVPEEPLAPPSSTQIAQAGP